VLKFRLKLQEFGVDPAFKERLLLAVCPIEEDIYYRQYAQRHQERESEAGECVGQLIATRFTELARLLRGELA
jgi:hypothetical protein